MLENMYTCGAYCFAAGAIIATVACIIAAAADDRRNKGERK